VQFRSRLAFKLVWVPPEFETFVLVDDDGKRLALGKPWGRLPALPYRQHNFELVGKSKYAIEAELAGIEPAVGAIAAAAVAAAAAAAAAAERTDEGQPELLQWRQQQQDRQHMAPLP
jgi:hypothetical protein